MDHQSRRNIIYAALGFFIATSLVSPNGSAAQDLGRFLRWSYQDVGDLIKGTNRRTPLYALGAFGTFAALSPLDTPVDREVNSADRGLVGSYLRLTNRLGGPTIKFPVAAIFGATLLTDNKRLQDAAFTSLQSLVYVGTATAIIKLGAGRVRPPDATGPYEFLPFSGNTSFPSGHTSAAFALLTPWAVYYPHPVTYVVLGIGAGGTAIARVAHDKHWATDVLAGGMLGFMTAYWLSRHHQGRRARLLVVPEIRHDGVAAHLALRF